MPEEPEKTRDDYAPESTPVDMMSYTNMGVTQRRWAPTRRGWRNVLAVALVVTLCLAANMACIVLYSGPDRLFEMLAGNNEPSPAPYQPLQVIGPTPILEKLKLVCRRDSRHRCISARCPVL